MAELIDGKRISTIIKDECKKKVEEYKAQGIEICLAVIQVGNDPASSVYVNNKKKGCRMQHGNKRSDSHFKGKISERDSGHRN